MSGNAAPQSAAASVERLPGDRSAGEKQPSPAVADVATAAPSPAPASPVPPGPTAATMPALAAFLGTEDTRLRDLLAFAMAAEAARPLAADGIEALRRKADADLQAHAFRTLHNNLEAIRREAQAEERARQRRPLGFLGAVTANLVAVALCAGAAWLLWHNPALLPTGL